MICRLRFGHTLAAQGSKSANIGTVGHTRSTSLQRKAEPDRPVFNRAGEGNRNPVFSLGS